MRSVAGCDNGQLGLVEPLPNDASAALTFPVKAALFVLFAFVALVPVVIWNGTLTAADVKLLLARVLIISISVILSVDVLRKKTFSVPDVPLLACAVGFVGYSAVVCRIRPYADWGLWGDQSLSVLLFLEAVVLLRDDFLVRKFLSVWQASLCLVCVYFLMQRAGLDIVKWQMSAADMAGSTFTNRNIMVYYLVCSFPFGAYLLVTRRGWSRVLPGISLALSLATLLLCYSRVSIVILCVTLPAYLLYGLHRTAHPRLRTILRLSVLIVFAATVVVAVGCALYVFSLSSAGLNAFTHSRFVLWKDTARFVMSDPWFGHGAGSFAKIFPAFRSAELGKLFTFYQPVFNSHNEVLEILSETGIVGLVLFTTLVVRGTRLGLATASVSTDARRLRFFAYMSIVNCLIFSTVGEASHMFASGVFSWLSLAICYNSKAGGPRSIALSRRSYAAFIGVFAVWCIISTGGFYLIGRDFLADVHVQRATWVLKTSRNLDRAEQELGQALWYDPNNRYALYQRAYVATARGRYNDALRDYQRIKASDPYFENISYNEGVLHFLQEDYPKAIADLSFALRTYPTFGNGLFYLAQSYYNAGRFKECIYYCNKLVAEEHGNGRGKVLRDLAKKKADTQVDPNRHIPQNPYQK